LTPALSIIATGNVKLDVEFTSPSAMERPVSSATDLMGAADLVKMPA
jgi:hypothetical protein